MSTDSPHDDLVHDEYLRTALRHAPDHGLTPPSSVTQTILAAARQVHRPVRRTVAPTPVRATIAGRPRWREILPFLGSPRWAGGFATGLVAALVVGLWIDSDPPIPVSPPPEATSIVAARRDTATEPAGGVRSTLQSRVDSPVDAARKAAQPAVRPAPEPAREAIAPAPSAPVAEVPPRAESDSKVQSVQAVPTEPSRQAGVTAESRQEALGKSAAKANDPRMPTAAPRAEAAPVRDTAAQAAASPALTLLRRIRAESTAQSARWTWQAPGATAPRPVDADGLAWLLRLVQAARGRWVDVAVPSDPGPATEVRWWHDGQPHARLRIEADGLRWLEPSGRIRFAPLDPQALEPLRSY